MARKRLGKMSLKTNHTIKALETKYNGHKFRSRTEARWSIYFDVLRIKYEYESKWFRTKEGGYLPDFFVSCRPLPKGVWLEIKGPEPVERDYVRAREVIRQTDIPLFFLVGSVPIEALPQGLAIRTYVGSKDVWTSAFWSLPAWPQSLRQEALDEANFHVF
jgi:hypothetical protein